MSFNMAAFTISYLGRSKLYALSSFAQRMQQHCHLSWPSETENVWFLDKKWVSVC